VGVVQCGGIEMRLSGCGILASIFILPKLIFVFAGHEKCYFDRFVVSPDNQYLVFLGKNGYLILVSNKVMHSVCVCVRACVCACVRAVVSNATDCVVDN